MAKDYASEPRHRMEAGVHHAFIGQGKHYVRAGRVTERDSLHVKFALKHDPSKIIALEEVSGVRAIFSSRCDWSKLKIIELTDFGGGV